MSNICILATGGTIDKDHDPVTETLVFSDKSYVPEILKQCRAPKIPHHVLMLKDSLDMDDNDREAILQGVLARPETHIIITHGTGTMEKTAAHLKGKVDNKIVILTGSMRPFSLFRSDAGFNLGYALAAAKLASSGVYIAMNGEIFEAGQVTKDRSTGFFKSA